MSPRLFPLALTAVLAAAQPAAAAEPAGKRVDFARDVKPILDAACVGCHGPQKQWGQLRLDTRSLAMKGGLTGPAIVPGKSGESLLFQLLISKDEEQRMPRKADPLPKAQLDIIRAWIDQGAEWPGAVAQAEPETKKHWAYVKPARPAVPAVSRPAWVRNPIDAFVLSRLDREKLAPSVEAGRETLLRRVSLDLTGLPPTSAEIDAFLGDRRPDAYERAVDRLLASPHHGERWARVWLDLARYADSNGYEKDDLRVMWKYRDWVIRALNADMPFDQFTIEQLAGDMLPGATLDQQIASGFHANTMLNEEGGVDADEARYEVLVDRVNTTGAVWLGSTIGCAQCHNHKYDPISQKEYFGLLAFFDNGETFKGRDNAGNNALPLNDPRIRVPTPAQAKQLAAIEAEIARRQAALETATPALAAAQATWEAETRALLDSWRTLEASRVVATSRATFARQRDGSLVVRGPNPRNDRYTIAVRPSVKRMTGLRLDVLPDPSLPSDGPGRGPNGGFMLTEVVVKVAPAGRPADARTVELKSAATDRNGPHASVQEAIDGKPQTGWSVGDSHGKPHVAVFTLAQPLDLAADAVLTVELAHDSVHRQHGLGRFRLAATETAQPAATLKMPERIRALLAVPGARHDEAQRAELAAYYRGIAPLLDGARAEIAELRKKIDTLGIPTATVLRERPGFDRPSTMLRIRGAFTSPGDRVYASVPAVLNRLPDHAPANRLGLARWLVDKENPLTARVTVNRLWEQYFGRGLVETSEDFGAQGSAPSHPELLDWLATELVERKWSQKAMHRLIVTSAAYRQASRTTPELLEKDPYNRLYARGPRFRVEAETLRDVALAASGLLSRKVGGPSVFPPQPDGIWDSPYDTKNKWVTSTGEDRYRRGLYTFLRRSAPYPMMTTFDATSRELCTVRRVRTNTPLQALNLLNDPAFFEAAQGLGRRMVREAGADPRARATHGFRLVTGRRPKREELDRLVALYQRERDRFARQGGGTQVAPVALRASSADDLAAWTLVANVLLNLDETQTKE